MADLRALESYSGKNRLLLMFTPSPKDPRYLEQKRLFEAVGAELRERDVLVFYLFPNEPGETVDGELESQASATLRERFAVADSGLADRGLTALLIGKDGGEKKCFSRPVEPAVLFNMINQMPMRRREMQEKSN